ncbi:MAG TPA: glycosyltransferase family 2 protein [Ktedonobacteraceae bacterium]|jgi:chlorobactene glucosyltransferase
MSIRRGPQPSSRRTLLSALLLVSALVALWQCHRTRKSQKEACRPQVTPLPASPPSVSIIVPMRNEAAHIDACLASLCAQDYPAFEVLVVDDGSDDETPQRLADWIRGDPRVRSQRIEHLPAGWAGKTYALHTGVLLTQGEWIVFTDADTRHSAQLLRIMMGHALRQRSDFLSLWPDVMTLSGPAMPLLWPITAILLAHRVTPAEVRDPASRRAFGFGQYILLRRASYLASGGYNTAGMRTTAVDDLALAEQIKQAGWHLEVVNGRGLLQNLQWTTWRGARQGWVKSCYGEVARDNLLLLALPCALALCAYGLFPSGWLLSALAGGHRSRLSTLLAGITVLVQVATKRCVDRAYGLPLAWSLSAPISWAVCGVMLLDVARLLLPGQRASWKGRLLPVQEQARRARPSYLEKGSPGGSGGGEDGASARA